MNLQKIKSVNGKDEYVLLPINTYKLLKKQIDHVLDDEYVNFDLKDYITNPAALARINYGFTQEELAKYLNVSQAYISKIENQVKVPFAFIQKIKKISKNSSHSRH